MSPEFTYKSLDELKGLKGAQLYEWLDEYLAIQREKTDKEEARAREKNELEEKERQKQRPGLLDRFNKYGSAQSRFVNPDDIPYKQVVFEEIQKLSRNYVGKYNLTENIYYKDKAERLERQAQRFRYCGFEYIILKCSDCSQSFLGAGRCESRLCKRCAKKHGARVWTRQMVIIKNLPVDGRHRLSFLTLTKRVDPLKLPNEFDVRALAKCGRKLINKLYPKKFNNGAFAVIEIGENNNIHIHALVYGPYIKQERISELWLKITGDSSIVYIRAVRSPKKCVNYLLKYISKPPEYKNPEKYAQFLDAIYRVRRIHTYGVFYGCRLFKKDPFPCYFCGSKLKYKGSDGGMNLPIDALLLSELGSFSNNN